MGNGDCAMTDDRLRIVHTYYRNEFGEMRELVTMGDRVLYEGDSRAIFIDTSTWHPWERKLVVQ